MARKNPAAVKLGRLGGKARSEKLSFEELSEIGRKGGQLGGQRRAAVLSEKQRKEIARKAAAARWEGHKAQRPSGRKKPSK
jgi:hypothetical protein